MGQQASASAYERLISALSVFEKRTLDISEYLVKCAALATKAMDNDDPSVALKRKVDLIVSQMLIVSEKSKSMKGSMQETYDLLRRLEQSQSTEE